MVSRRRTLYTAAALFVGATAATVAISDLAYAHHPVVSCDQDDGEWVVRSDRPDRGKEWRVNGEPWIGESFEFRFPGTSSDFTAVADWRPGGPRGVKRTGHGPCLPPQTTTTIPETTTTWPDTTSTSSTTPPTTEPPPTSSTTTSVASTTTTVVETSTTASTTTTTEPTPSTTTPSTPPSSDPPSIVTLPNTGPGPTTGIMSVLSGLLVTVGLALTVVAARARRSTP